jgi:hypothetical protein
MTETFRKNGVIIAKYVRIIHVNVTVIAIILSEKNGGVPFVSPLAVLSAGGQMIAVLPQILVRIMCSLYWAYMQKWKMHDCTESSVCTFCISAGE